MLNIICLVCKLDNYYNKVPHKLSIFAFAQFLKILEYLISTKLSIQTRNKDFFHNDFIYNLYYVAIQKVLIVGT